MFPLTVRGRDRQQCCRVEHRGQVPGAVFLCEEATAAAYHAQSNLNTAGRRSQDEWVLLCREGEVRALRHLCHFLASECVWSWFCHVCVPLPVHFIVCTRFVAGYPHHRPPPTLTPASLSSSGTTCNSETARRHQVLMTCTSFQQQQQATPQQIEAQGIFWPLLGSVVLSLWLSSTAKHSWRSYCFCGLRCEEWKVLWRELRDVSCHIVKVRASARSW